MAKSSSPENQTALEWKAVGSPARRASILQEGNEPLPTSEEMAFRARAMSNPQPTFVPDVAPPGLADRKKSLQNESWNPQGWSRAKLWSPGVAEDVQLPNAVMAAIDSDLNPENNASTEQSGLEDDSNLTQEEYDAIPKGRSRSKSSSAIFSLPEDDIPTALPDMSSIWENKDTTPLHRRASTQPSQQTHVWEALKSSQLATPADMNGSNTEELLERFRQQTTDAGVRRFSVAPSAVNRFIANNEEVSLSQGRRHSLAAPPFERKLNTSLLTKGFEEMGLENPGTQLETIDDYFENTSNRTRQFMEAEKNLQTNTSALSPSALISPPPRPSHRWPLYVVEFKAGRTDFFYITDETIKVNIGDLAIVEADRGKDLGKVIDCGIQNLQELELYQATHSNPLVDSHVGKDVQPKRIFRVAQPSEVAMLLQKGQDEAKAMGVCQVKIRQKKLPMEIVDAEYQWDRRKLTFYFVAERRIDFRELVRELFKIYKTRIWM